MKRRQWVSALVAVALAAAACQKAPGAAPAGGQARAEATSRPAGWRAFEPPADGRLTATQVEMYVAVRRQAVLLKKAPARDEAAAGQLADQAASERRAVVELGQDVDEYRWVSARIAEASPPAADVLGDLAGGIEASAREGRKQVLEVAARDHVPVATEEKGTDAQAQAYNRELVDRYRSQLDALGTLHAPPPAAAPPRS
jgi:hypothetical protein